MFGGKFSRYFLEKQVAQIPMFNDPTHPYPIKDPTHHDPLKVLTHKKLCSPKKITRKMHKTVFPKIRYDKMLQHTPKGINIPTQAVVSQKVRTKTNVSRKYIKVEPAKKVEPPNRIIYIYLFLTKTRTVWPYSTSYWNSNVVPRWSSLWVLPRWILKHRSFHRSLWSSLGFFSLSTGVSTGKTNWGPWLCII